MKLVSQIFFISVLTSIFFFNTKNILADVAKRNLSIDDAVAIAVENNHNLQISKADIEIARSEIKSAKSNYYPQIETKIVVPFVGRESGFFLDQLIWDFGRTSSLVKSKESEYEATQHSYKKNLYETIQDTKIAYYKVLLAKHNQIAAESHLNRSKILFAKTEELSKVGRSSNIDLTRASSDLGLAELELLNSKNMVEIAKLELLDIMGIDGDFELMEESTTEFEEYNLESATKKAVERSSELKNLEAQQTAIKAKLSASKSEFLPVIFGRTAYRFEGEGGEDEDGDDPPAFIAGVGIKFPIFLGFSRFAKLDKTSAQFTKSQIQIEKTKQKIIKEVKKRFLELKYARERIKITDSSRQLSKKNLKLIQEKLRLERASKVDLSDAEASYLSSNAKYLEAIYNFKISKTIFKRIVGELQI